MKTKTVVTIILVLFWISLIVIFIGAGIFK